MNSEKLFWVARFFGGNVEYSGGEGFIDGISILPIQAPSIRTCAIRFGPESTTAMFIGWLISDARFWAAEIISPLSMSIKPSPSHEASD
jgi:hypothetical protein